MKEERRLNLSIGESISALRHFLKSFETRNKTYKIFFRGKSFDFDGFRPFNNGEDDFSAVDWKASGRSQKIMVRKYREEEEKKILFVVDTGENMLFGSTEKLKCEYAAELVISMADMVIKENDRAGLILFNDKVSRIETPKRGKKQFELFVSVLSNPDNYKSGSNISSAIDLMLESPMKGVSAIVLVSDFINFDKRTKHSLELLGNKYETIAFMIKDPIDISLPDVGGEYIVEDPSTHQQLLIEPRLARKNYEKHALKQEEFVKQSFKEANIDYLSLSTASPFIFDVIEFMKRRVKKVIAI